jgi:2-desacetyl-2-hydroxyethyl bacteriochlorophyllide A dehydrogenase
MKALVWRGPHAMEVVEAAEPEAGAGEVVLEVEAAGICGSELEGYLGGGGLRVPPQVMGHEFAGRVARAGAGVAEALVGRRVAVNPLIACGACAACSEGRTNVCLRRRLIGVHRPGAFAERVAVPASACFAVPEGMDPVRTALVEPLANAVHAVRLGAVRVGDRVAVIGAGTIGLMLLTAARTAGAGQVAVVDTLDGRLDVARDLGADLTLSPSGGDPAEALARVWGEDGADVAIDAVGRAATRNLAVRAARPGGSVVLVGLHDTASSLDVNVAIRNELRLLPSYSYTAEDFRRAVRLLARGVPTPGPWIEVRPLAAGPAAFEELIERPGRVAKVMLRP